MSGKPLQIPVFGEDMTNNLLVAQTSVHLIQYLHRITYNFPCMHEPDRVSFGSTRSETNCCSVCVLFWMTFCQTNKIKHFWPLGRIFRVSPDLAVSADFLCHQTYYISAELSYFFFG